MALLCQNHESLITIHQETTRDKFFLDMLSLKRNTRIGCEHPEEEGRERKKGRERVRERNLCMNYENYHQFPGGKKERNMLIIPQRFRN